MLHLGVKKNADYGIFVLVMLAVFSLLGWLTRKKWLGWLKEIDAGRTQIARKKSYRFLVGEAIWVFLLLFEFLFIDILPVSFLGTAAGNMSSAYVDAGIIAFAAWSFWQN